MDVPPSNEISRLDHKPEKPHADSVHHEVRTHADCQATRTGQLLATATYPIPQPINGSKMNPSNFNPYYVQISAQEAAAILGISIGEFHNRRREDNHCPTGFKERESWMLPMRFRLSDIYAYSDFIMKTAMPASVDPNVNTE